MTATDSSTCPACHAPLTEGARYCHRCGRAAVGGSVDRAPWIMAWALVALSLGGIGWFVATKDARAAGPDMANAGNAAPVGGQAAGGAPPDISQMTPRERFLRLHDRIMSAVGAGDTATAQRFAPMALQAYGMLDPIDADARYHAGAINIQLGDFPAALALADTIQAGAPAHLFADLLRLEAAQASGDQAQATRAGQSFLRHLDAELQTGRPEYQEHRAMLDQLQQRLSAQP